jgi:4-hydroxy-3-methylbut-2-en-1-yl diphosphate reductase
MEETYFRRGFGLRSQVKPVIDQEYHSALVQGIRSRGNVQVFEDVTVRLAEEFGFCYGVDRAIDYAYETRHKFPDRKIFLVGEIIHNPHVNQRMREMEIQVIYPNEDGAFDFDHIQPEDVVIMPAFGVALGDFKRLKKLGCILVDTTCGSVLLVWKRVESYARDGFTSVIHGKHHHEESRATASQANKYENGHYVIVRDMEEAELLCDYITGASGCMTREAFLDSFAKKASEGFDPDLHLERVGVANQTTMLANDSLRIGARLRTAMLEAHGEEDLDAHFRSFGTICSATQERQDAVQRMMEEHRPDVMIVIGGYNSSNTNHLAHLARQYTTTYHIEDAACIDVQAGTIRHKPVVDAEAAEQLVQEFLPEGNFTLGLTAGASTPNNKVGEALVRALAIRGIDTD